MIVSIHQPNYLPYLGYFEKMASSDVFILYDDAEFVKEMFYNRNRIKTPEGALWISIPIIYRFSDHQKINEVKIDPLKKWNNKHWKTIKQFYSKSKYYHEICELIESIYQKSWEKLSDVNIALILTIKDYLGIKTRIALSSEYNVSGDRSEKLLKLCKNFRATVYLAGSTGKKYLDENLFLDHGINISYQKFEHPKYNQLFGDFLPNMNILDLLFNEGPNSFRILKNDKYDNF